MCQSSAERCGADQSATSSAYARQYSTCQAMNRFPFDLLQTKFHMQHNFINTQYDHKNTILNPKLHGKPKTTIQLHQS